MPSEELFFNGINGATGSYLLPPMSPQDLSKIARGETLDESHLLELKSWYERTSQKHFGPKEGVDPKKLDESGWGVLFAFEDKDRVPAIREALKELPGPAEGTDRGTLPGVRRPRFLPAR